MCLLDFWICSDPVLSPCVPRWVLQARSLAYWHASSWNSSRAGRSWHSHGGHSPNCCASFCSSSPSACCLGLTILPTSAAFCQVSFCHLPSCPTSASAAWTCTASAARSLSHSHCSWASSLVLWCSFMSIPLSVSFVNCSPAFPWQISFVRSMTWMPISIDTAMRKSGQGFWASWLLFCSNFGVGREWRTPSAPPEVWMMAAWTMLVFCVFYSLTVSWNTNFDHLDELYNPNPSPPPNIFLFLVCYWSSVKQGR